MKIELESTDRIVHIADDTSGAMVPARVWEGRTESGIDVYALVTRVACRAGADTAQFERELRACKAPSDAACAAFPRRLVL